ncbi:MAG: hypothetical protein U0414_24750 [Polyangiaceae bacterium]
MSSRASSAARVRAVAFAVSLLSFVSACGGAEPASDAATAEGAPAASWQERFHRPSASSRPRATTLGPLTTEERTATAEEKSRTKTLFNEGMVLMDAGDMAGACEKFAAAHALMPGGVPLLRLSECLEKLHDHVGACEAAKGAVVMLERGPAQVRGALDRARKRVDELGCL